MQKEIDTAPLSERFNLVTFTDSLITDLNLLRAGHITAKDAVARAELAKQVLKSIGLVISAQKYLAASSKQIEVVK